MEPDLTSYFNDETAEKIATDIIRHLIKFFEYNKFKTQVDKQEKIGHVDFSYDLSSGKVVDTENSNTWYSFDLDQGTIAYEFMQALFSREVTEQEEQQIVEFTEKVNTVIIANHIETLRNVVRNTVLPDSDPKSIPLTKIDIMEMEIVDYSAIHEADKHMLKVIKLPGSHVNMAAVLERIQEIRETNPLLSLEDLVQKERVAANPLFDSVIGIEVGHKYLWNVHMSIFVDYSLSQESQEAKPQ